MEFDLEYNSQREHLIIPEYGRNVQNLINEAKGIEDDAYRQAFVEKVVDLMLQLNPHNKNLDDVREKIWLHVFRIADYDLKVTPPKGLDPKPESKRKKPESVPYPHMMLRFRHYGNNVHNLIARALEMEEGPIKQGFVATIGAYMKLAYRTWNKEHYVSDDTIIDDLESLSEGKLVIDEGAELDGLTQANRRKRREYDDRRDDRRGGRDDRRGGDRRDDRRGGGRNSNDRRGGDRRDDRRGGGDRRDDRRSGGGYGRGGSNRGGGRNNGGGRGRR